MRVVTRRRRRIISCTVVGLSIYLPIHSPPAAAAAPPPNAIRDGVWRTLPLLLSVTK